MLPIRQIPVSITGQTWCWRGDRAGLDGDQSLIPDDLITQLILARGCVREEVDACKTFTDVDVFLSHEAPRPFRVHRGIDAGKTPINEVLAAMRPRLHLFGHHHRFSELIVKDVRSLCLDLVSNAYLLIDVKTLEYQHLTT